MALDILILFLLSANLGALAAGVLFTADKTKLIEWYQGNRKIWMPEYCQFCVSFWFSLAVFLILIYAGFPKDWIYWPAPLMGAAYSRALIS